MKECLALSAKTLDADCSHFGSLCVYYLKPMEIAFKRGRS